MELPLVMSVLRPGENVSPDLSSYEAMAASWRGSGECPSKAECQAKWNELKESFKQKQVAHKRSLEYRKRGASPEIVLNALLKKVVNNDASEITAIKSTIDQVNSENL